MQTTINYEAYFELRFGFLNPDGGRGFDNGIRILSECPECGDRRGKAWLNIFTEKIKCFRDSCPAYDGERHGGSYKDLRIFHRVAKLYYF